MKKLFILLLFLVPALAHAGGQATPVDIDTGTIASGGAFTTEPIRIDRIDGFSSLQISGFTGDGEVSIEALVSNDGTTWLEPEGASDVATALTRTSGPNADGKVFISFRVPLAKSMKLKFSSANDTASLTCVLMKK